MTLVWLNLHLVYSMNNAHNFDLLTAYFCGNLCKSDATFMKALLTQYLERNFKQYKMLPTTLLLKL